MNGSCEIVETYVYESGDYFGSAAVMRSINANNSLERLPSGRQRRSLADLAKVQRTLTVDEARVQPLLGRIHRFGDIVALLTLRFVLVLERWSAPFALQQQKVNDLFGIVTGDVAAIAWN